MGVGARLVVVLMEAVWDVMHVEPGVQRSMEGGRVNPSVSGRT